MIFRRYLAAVLLANAVVFSALALAAAGGTPVLESFKCYTGLSTVDEADLSLQDQLDGVAVEATVDTALNFCMPVAINNKGDKGTVANTGSYLTMYRLPNAGSAISRTASVSNLYGDAQVLSVFQPQNVAVVTSDAAGPAAAGLDNFKCYIARGTAPKGSSQLFDRFGSDKGVKVLDPALLCLPATLTVGELSFPAASTEVLACYGIKTSAFTGELSFTNPVSSDTVDLGVANILCVPSSLDSLS